jgi:glucan phosphoethanolaminetransferase (alkaline phosphatase superfamily)
MQTHIYSDPSVLIGLLTVIVTVTIYASPTLYAVESTTTKDHEINSKDHTNSSSYITWCGAFSVVIGILFGLWWISHRKKTSKKVISYTASLLIMFLVSIVCYNLTMTLFATDIPVQCGDGDNEECIDRKMKRIRVIITFCTLFILCEQIAIEKSTNPNHSNTNTY